LSTEPVDQIEAVEISNPYAEVIGDIASGARLHYDNEGSADPDLDLLLGDQRYASGLAKLAALGAPCGGRNCCSSRASRGCGAAPGGLAPALGSQERRS
jgi:hypothetical protein